MVPVILQVLFLLLYNVLLIISAIIHFFSPSSFRETRRLSVAAVVGAVCSLVVFLSYLTILIGRGDVAYFLLLSCGGIGFVASLATPIGGLVGILHSSCARFS